MKGRDGIASLLVLWAMLLLGTLALAFSLAMRTEAQAARNGLDGMKAYYHARSGVSRALALLSAVPVDNVLSMAIEGGDDEEGYAATLLPEDGKIDINAVPEAMLKEILEKGGLSPEGAESLGDALLDWRDPDDDRRPQGAEADDYARLPEPIRPRNGRVAAVGELRYVAGMTPAFFDAFVSKAFTAQPVGAAVNINAAPVELLRAMPGITPELAKAIVDRRKESRFAGPADVAQFLGEAGVPAHELARFSAGGVSRSFTVTSAGRAAGNARRTVSCLVEIGGMGENPVRMIQWNDRVSESEDQQR
jgi:general secretion pathway protein K